MTEENILLRMQEPGPGDRIDVVMAAAPGQLPVYAPGLVSWLHTRPLAAPGLVTIPRRERLWVAVIESETQFRHHVSPWNGVGRGWDFSAARDASLNTWSRLRGPARLLVEPQPWTEIEHSQISSVTRRGEAEWTIGRAGVAHGLAVWPEVVLDDTIVLANPWSDPESAVGHAFFPWPGPIPLSVGDRVSVRLDGTVSEGCGVWTWRSCVDPRHPSDRPSTSFTQSTFLANLELPSLLRQTRPGHVPARTM